MDKNISVYSTKELKQKCRHRRQKAWKTDANEVIIPLEQNIALIF
jgi:hypothetical protein